MYIYIYICHRISLPELKQLITNQRWYRLTYTSNDMLPQQHGLWLDKVHIARLDSLIMKSLRQASACWTSKNTLQLSIILIEEVRIIITGFASWCNLNAYHMAPWVVRTSDWISTEPYWTYSGRFALFLVAAAFIILSIASQHLMQRSSVASISLLAKLWSAFSSSCSPQSCGMLQTNSFARCFIQG